MLHFLSCFSRNRFSQLFHQQTLRRQEEEERKQEELNEKQQKELEQKEEYEGKRRKVSDTSEKERDDADISEKRRRFRFSSSQQKTPEEMGDIPAGGGCVGCLSLIYLSRASFKKKNALYNVLTPYDLFYHRQF